MSREQHPLINAARYYCIERSANWRRNYQELVHAQRHGNQLDGKWICSPDAFNVFPRYMYLENVLAEVEAIDLTISHEEIRTTLDLVGGTAVCAAADALAERAIQEERRIFREFALRITLEECKSIPEVPYRHTLSKADEDVLRLKVQGRWGEWYGGAVQEMSLPDTVVLHTDVMESGGYEQLHTVLANAGVERVFELKEFGLCREAALRTITFLYDMQEGSWTDASLSWFINASHEQSITFGGAQLIQEMRERLPEFQRFIYKGYDPSWY